MVTPACWPQGDTAGLNHLTDLKVLWLLRDNGAFWSSNVRAWAARPGPRPPLKLPADPRRANYLVIFCQVKTIILALFDAQVGENQASTGVCYVG